MFDEFEKNGILKTATSTYKEEITRKRKLSAKMKFYDGPAQETDLSGSARESFHINVFPPVIDQLWSALSKRMDAYSELNTKYGFLTNLLQLNGEELQQAAHHLISCYPKGSWTQPWR